jgi:mRNA interferase MazF
MRRGEVWLVNLDPTQGAEMRKTRPAVIVSSDLVGVLPLRVIVPLTDWKDRYGLAPWMVRVKASPQNGLEKDSAADCFQMRSLSVRRLVRKLGDLTEDEMTQIQGGMAVVLELDLEG